MFSILNSSVDGLFANYVIRSNSSFLLESGAELPTVHIAFQTWGNLTAKKVVWVCHALTGNQHVQDWWEGLFGSDKYFDPKEWLIVCVNTLGSAYGTTAPNSEETPEALKGHRFPVITNKDAAALFEQVRVFLKLESISLLIGASLGGQQAQEWLLSAPERFEKAILIATNAKHSPFGIAFNEAQRMALEADPTFFTREENAGGNGLKAARAIGMMSYRTYAGYGITQAETDNEKIDGFKAASYQRYQGEKLMKRFDAHAYYTLSKSMDSHNVFRNRAANPFDSVNIPVLVIGIDTDLLFPLTEQQTLASYFSQGQLAVIHSEFGHDGFLVAYEQLIQYINQFLNKN